MKLKLNPTMQKQTLFGEGNGNCFAACVASLLGVDLSDVPNLNHQDLDKDGSYWIWRWNKWLGKLGYGITCLPYHTGEGCDDNEPYYIDLATGQYVIVTGMSPRDFSMHHSIICVIDNKIGEQGERRIVVKGVFDPHPDNDWVVGSDHMIVLTQLNPRLKGVRGMKWPTEATKV